MDLTKLLERRAKKWPGIVQVASLLAVIAVLVLHKPEKEFTLWETALVLALAVLFHTMGGTLDDIVFDPLYGLKPSGLLKRAWRFIARGMFFPIKFIADLLPRTKEMANERKAATEELRTRISGSTFTCGKDDDCKGIYNSAKTLLESSEEWDDHVKPWLEMSKTIRSFVWPLIVVLVYDVEHYRWRMAWLDRLLSPRALNWLTWWEVSLSALLLALVLYVWLRAFHMRAMYKLVNNSEYIAYPIGRESRREYRTAIPARHLSIGETDGQQKVKPRPVFLLVAMR